MQTFRVAQALSILALVFQFASLTPALADAVTDTSLRNTFKQAEKHLWHSNSSRYKELYQKLHYYPLQPYLDQQRLITHLSLSKTKEIDDFLSQYKGSPLDWPLRKKWLRLLAKRKQKLLFLEYFTPNNDVAMNCQHLLFQLSNGVVPDIVLPQATKYWLSGKSQPKACDPLFKRWQQAGYRSPDIVWQRLALAAQGGKHTLIPYLTKLLPEKQQYLGRLWHKVRRDPSYVTKLQHFTKNAAKEVQILTYGLKRLVWRDPKRALMTYEKASVAFDFSMQQQQSIAAKFALALASKNHTQAKVWLDKVDDESLTKTMVQWRLVQVLKQQDWQQLKSELLTLPDKYQSALQWRYWYARSLLGLNEKDRGESLLKELSQQRHYYGFLAAGYLKQPVNLQDKPITISTQERKDILANPAAKRAFELFYLQRFGLARREWNYWLSQLTDRQKLVASKVANEAQWFDRAIFTLPKVGYLDDVDLRFPLAFDQSIKQQAQKQNINPAWAFAIARKESSFMTDANSPAGAKGLMQLLPSTAKEVGRRSISKNYLFDASNNIKLGTKYLRQLLNGNKGNSVLATASYNAGPYRVKQWLKNSETMPADMWIETIPYTETRDYVKSVLAYQQIYQFKVGQNNSLFDKLSDMHIAK